MAALLRVEWSWWCPVSIGSATATVTGVRSTGLVTPFRKCSGLVRVPAFRQLFSGGTTFHPDRERCARVFPLTSNRSVFVRVPVNRQPLPWAQGSARVFPLTSNRSVFVRVPVNRQPLPWAQRSARVFPWKSDRSVFVRGSGQ